MKSSKKVSKRCWVNDELGSEIHNNYPTKNDMSVNEGLGEISRDLNVFTTKCATFFLLVECF